MPRKSLKLLSDGFSLIEVVVAVGIGGIISSVVATIFVFAVEQFTVLVEQNAAEESLLWASYTTRAFLGQAVDLKVTSGSAIDPDITPTESGRILSQYSSTDAFRIGNTAAVAVFGRENMTGVSTNAMTSDIYASAVFVFSPPITPTGSSAAPVGGAIYFDPGAPVSATMSATQNDVWFDRISEFRIEDVECVTDVGTAQGSACNGWTAKSATIVIKARYFKTARRNRWIWQQMSVIPAGTDVGPFRDVEMSIKVGFRNNLLLGGTSGPQSRVGMEGQERLHGGLYFFRMTLPPLQGP